MSLSIRWAEHVRSGAHGRLRAYLRDQHVHPAPAPISPDDGLVRRVIDEVRWSFAPPRYWLEGVGVNALLSLLYLVYSPLAHPHRRFGWVVLVGTYFATFILADVTTTNVLGLDAPRVRRSLDAGMPMRGILLTKNLALLVIVGMPTLLLTAILAHSMRPRPFIGTLFAVALPLLCWLGVGNIVSVLLAVETRTLIRRWREFRSWTTVLWIAHLALPYGVYYLIAPIDGLQHDPLLRLLPHLDRNLRFVWNAGVGLLVWVIGTAIALAIVRRRGLRIY
ncbi:hypothetical protein KO481_33870 [Nocardia sp. NEAU-G5]|uniref:ABC transporter permease n=1 Tax=Nocardia albiluteola TaxID=2842303 RepID=A0ABS6B859_9NOCA|nr:hypothetical protein [Nocardia albiluteola]MBU3066497.1 hypothetical protein [Nocardia albiluteola]